ncbi:MAG: NADP-dependent isocitrate dehydrogenase, partial [Myxococcota bacterium]
MLVHLGHAGVAETIKNAWLATLESGIHPSDIYRPGVSTRQVGTDDFTDAVIARLGETPRQLEPVHYQANRIAVDPTPTPEVEKVLTGIDVFLDWSAFDRNPNVLGKTLEAACPDDWRLKMITNRGVKVYPDGVPETFCTDHWRCRFLPDGDATSFDRVLALLVEIHERGLEVIKTEHLYTFDGARGYSLGQGE